MLRYLLIDIIFVHGHQESLGVMSAQSELDPHSPPWRCQAIFLGLPVGFLPLILQCNILFGKLSLFVLTTCSKRSFCIYDDFPHLQCLHFSSCPSELHRSSSTLLTRKPAVFCPLQCSCFRTLQDNANDLYIWTSPSFVCSLKPIRQTFIPQPLFHYSIILSPLFFIKVSAPICSELRTCLLNRNKAKQRLSPCYAAANRKPGLLAEFLAYVNLE